MIIAANDDTFRHLCVALGNPEMAGDPRFINGAGRKANEDTLKVEMEKLLCGRTASEWEKALAEANVPCAIVATVPDAVENPQLQIRNMIVRAGEIRVAGNPIKISTVPDSAARKPAPQLDADGPRIRAEFAAKK